MNSWRQQEGLWVLEPRRPHSGLVEFIGGSGLAATPQFSYRRLLQALAEAGWWIHAWSYVPGFDHQAQANAAWRCFREARQAIGTTHSPRTVRLGHSLGCKLHLLAPDGGRGCNGQVALSFNNFSAERSIPLLAEIGQQFNVRSEFSPSPRETWRQVTLSYSQPHNLLVRFTRDNLDQSNRLLAALRERAADRSTLVELPGDHLTPSSAGLRRQLLGDWADDPSRQRDMVRLTELISGWQPAA